MRGRDDEHDQRRRGDEVEDAMRKNRPEQDSPRRLLLLAELAV